jgi:RNA polymerase sigma-70 factor (ECF subfamily)
MTYAEPPGDAACDQPSSAQVRTLPGQERLRTAAHLTELVTRITHQDQAALHALYDASIGHVYGLALRITRQHEAAEAVAEDVYMQVWKEAARFDAQRGSVLAWLLTICRSRALDHWRRRDGAEPRPETLTDETITAGGDPQDLLLAVDSNSGVHAVLQELNAVQRQLLALVFFRGLSHQAVADHTRMPLGTVKTHLRKALAAIRTTLTDCHSVAA